jgi:hypothetical protein
MEKEVLNGFELSKIKLLKNGGIEIAYSQAMTSGDVTNTDTFLRKSTKDPHPDMVNAIAGLNKYLAKVHNLLAFKSLLKINATAKLSEAVKTMESTFEKLEGEVLKHIEVTGVSISGDEDNMGIVITGVNRYNGEAIALNTSRINLSGTKHGFEIGLAEDIEFIIEEVKAYLFKGKAAQLELDFDAEAKAS